MNTLLNLLQTYTLPPNSYFSSDFAHFILEILNNLKILAYVQNYFFKKHDFWGYPPGILNRGGDTSPPPVATPMRLIIGYWLQKKKSLRM